MRWAENCEPNKMVAASNPSAKPKSSSGVGQNKLTLKQRVEIINGIDNRLISRAQSMKQYGISTMLQPAKKRGLFRAVQSWNQFGN